MEYSYVKMNQELNKNNFNFKKKFGQNFIIDENIINNIIQKSNVDKDTLVLEIGPGAGALTYKLCLKAGFVLCYEIDTSLKEILEKNLQAFNNYKVIYEDFLKTDLDQELKKYSFKKIYVIANLPYYITTPIIMKLIDNNISIDKIVVMVQKEVGNRFKAETNSKDYNSLSVFLNYYFDIKKIMDVSKNVFIPKPNVDSVVIELKKKEKKLALKNKEIFFKLIRDSFKQKRKTLKNNLKDYDLQKISYVLEKYKLDLNVRAEQIPLSIFVEIANNLQ